MINKDILQMAHIDILQEGYKMIRIRIQNDLRIIDIMRMLPRYETLNDM